MQNRDEQNDNLLSSNSIPTQSDPVTMPVADPVSAADLGAPGSPHVVNPGADENLQVSSLASPNDSAPIINSTSAQNHVQQQPEGASNKKLIIGIASLAITFIVAVSSFAFWYFGVRVSNIEYDKAVAVVDAMITDAEAIDEVKSSMKQSTSSAASLTSITLTQTNPDQALLRSMMDQARDAKNSAAAYVANMKKLENIAAIQKDAAVKAVYETNKKVIDEFGVTSDELYKTTYIFYMLADRCIIDKSFVPTDKIKTADQFDQHAKACKDFLMANESVPSKEFNDELYIPFRGALLACINNVSQLYKEVPGSEGWDRVLANIQEISQEIKRLNTIKIDTIDNSQNPKKQLNTLKVKLNERKEVLFR